LKVHLPGGGSERVNKAQKTGFLGSVNKSEAHTLAIRHKSWRFALILGKWSLSTAVIYTENRQGPNARMPIVAGQTGDELAENMQFYFLPRRFHGLTLTIIIENGFPDSHQAVS
jgi:hypothetical protein